MKIRASLQQAFVSKQKLLVPFGVINPARRKNQFATLLGVLNDQLTMVFDSSTPAELLNHVRRGSYR